MYTTIHSLKKSFNSRKKSQNNSQNKNKVYLQQSVLKRKPKFSLDRITPSKAMNILVNGKKINEILTPIRNKTTHHQSILNASKSPNKSSQLKEYIYRKYLTEFDQQLNPHVEGIIKIRQIFNQRTKGRSSSENVEVKPFGLTFQSNMYQPNKQLSKILNIRNPDIYPITSKKRNGKYQQKQKQQKSESRSFYLCKQMRRNKYHKIVEPQNDKVSGFDIQPWEAD